MVNESIYRSPKWLRNFADFEINTGKDIKGEPSLKRKKEMEEERRIKAEKEAKEEESRKKAEKERDTREFNRHFETVIGYIYNHYKECKISIPSNNKFTIERDDLILDTLSFKFKITLNDEIQMPTFNVYINYGKKYYNYTTSGIIYTQFKTFLIDVVYFWYKREGYKSSAKSDKKTSSSWNPYGEDEWGGKSSTKTKNSQTPEEENKRRRYQLLIDTKDGYVRKWNTIIQWERQNPGKVHPEKAETRIMIDNVKDKIQKMKDAYHFESLKHLKSYKLYENF